MDLSLINQFIAFYHYGNLSKAAQALHTSQPALSRAMKNLELELGVPLFVRTRNKIAFNEYGELAVHHAMHIAESVVYLKSSVRELYMHDQNISLASCGSAPLWTLPYLIQEFYPGKTVDSKICPMPEIKACLEAGSVQLGVFAGPFDEPGYVSKKCISERLCFSVPKGHPLAGKDGVRFEEINGESVIVISTMGYWSEVITRMMDKSRFIVKDYSENFVASVENSGLPFFSSDLAQRERLFAPGRVSLPVLDPEAQVDYYVVCRESEYERLKDVFDRMESY